MTRVTKMGRKKFLKSSFVLDGGEFKVKPLVPAKRTTEERNEAKQEEILKGNEAEVEKLVNELNNENQISIKEPLTVKEASQEDLQVIQEQTSKMEGDVNQAESAGGKKKRMRHRDPKEKVEKECEKNVEGSQNINPHAHLAGLSKQEREVLKRRSRKQKAKEKKMECFLCRQKGHSIANCPRNTQQDAKEAFIYSAEGSSICYRCGSLEHILQKCDQKQNPKDPLPFSTCFVCNQKVNLDLIINRI